MQKQQQMVREFLAKHLGLDKDGWPRQTGIANKWLLIDEEFEELQEALGVGYEPVLDSFGQEMLDEQGYTQFELLHKHEHFDETKAVDAICDLLYVIFNLCEELHINIEPFFNEVHRSNMTKLPGALSPTKKIMKGSGWEPPRIAEMLEAHRAAGSLVPVKADTFVCPKCKSGTYPRGLHSEICINCMHLSLVAAVFGKAETLSS